MSYIGRFAPSPTGYLHFGSLLAATASYLEARSQGGSWLLRIEDLDKPREQTGAAEAIIRTLAAYGFEWDEPIIFQSSRISAYQDALMALSQHAYACSCSRKQLVQFNTIYPGFCRNKQLTEQQHATRLKVTDEIIGFNDRIQGQFCQNLETDLGDFVIRRADQLFSYQLAVVVDDAWQGITEVVRGSDLLDNTPRQIYLQQLLGYSTPNYAHIPIIINELGQKLSKQTLAPALETNTQHLINNLIKALNFLGQSVSDLNQAVSLDEFWRGAIKLWDINKVPKQLTRHQTIST